MQKQKKFKWKTEMVGDINLTTFIRREEAFENLVTNTKIEPCARSIWILRG